MFQGCGPWWLDLTSLDGPTLRSIWSAPIGLTGLLKGKKEGMELGGGGKLSEWT